MPGLHPHELRHTAASLAIASGADVKLVQRMLGHKSATMTLGQYGHLFDDRLNDVADRLDAAARAADVYPSCTRAEIVDLDDKRQNFALKTGSVGGCPRQDSNLRSRLRRAVLYPLSYGGVRTDRPYGRPAVRTDRPYGRPADPSQPSSRSDDRPGVGALALGVGATCSERERCFVSGWWEEPVVETRHARAGAAPFE
jgi:hypothetical protein